jgi:hypothetical protein
VSCSDPVMVVSVRFICLSFEEYFRESEYDYEKACDVYFSTKFDELRLRWITRSDVNSDVPCHCGVIQLLCGLI